MSDEARVIGAISAATGELDAPLKRELAPERRFESCWNALEKVPFLRKQGGTLRKRVLFSHDQGQSELLLIGLSA
jgi:hypothetical protein